MASPPVITLLPECFPPRRERQLRRGAISLGVTIDTSRSTTWNPKTTHVIASGVVPCAKWVCAVAAAGSVKIVSVAYLETVVEQRDLDVDWKPFQMRFGEGTLDVCIDMLWIGRVWCGAYAYWRGRVEQGLGNVWESHRICVVGRVKPRGGGGVVVCGRGILEAILKAGGGKIVEPGDGETFAVCGGGVQRDEVAKLLERGIICLGVGFVIDIVVRGEGDPGEYLLFEEQRELVGGKIVKGRGWGVPVTQRQMMQMKSKESKLKLRIDNCHDEEGVPRNIDTGNLEREEKDRGCIRVQGGVNSQRSGAGHSLEASLSGGNVKLSRKRVGTQSERFPGDGAREESMNVVEVIQKPSFTMQLRLRPVQTDGKCGKNEKPSVRMRRRLKAGNPVSLESCDVPVKNVTTDDNRVLEKMTVTKSSGNYKNGLVEVIDLCGSSSPATPEHVVNQEVRLSSLAESAESGEGGEERVGKKRRRGRLDEEKSKTRLEFDSPPKTDLQSMDVDDESPTPVSARLKDSTRVTLIEDNANPKLEFDLPRKIDFEAMDIDDEPGTRIEEGLKTCNDNSRSEMLCINIDNDDREKRSPTRKRFQPQTKKSSQSVSTYPRRTASIGLSGVNMIDVSEENNVAGYPRFQFMCESSHFLHSKSIETLEDGYKFVLQSLGGEASEREAANVVHQSKTSSASLDSVAQDNPSGKVDVASRPDSLVNAEDSPNFDQDELESPPNAGGESPFCLSTGDNDDFEVEEREEYGRLHMNCQNQPRRDCAGRASQLGHSVDAFKILVPKDHISLHNVLSPDFTRLEYAGNIKIVYGNMADDETRQDEVEFVEWIIAAERSVGSSPKWLSALEKGAMDPIVARINFALVESGALGRFSTAGSLSNSQVINLAGVCTRLISAPTIYDPGPALVQELLSLRDKQVLAGFDSLEVVVSSNGQASVPLRHQAVATIWSVLIHQPDQSPYRVQLWKLFNKACNVRLHEMFSEPKSIHAVTVQCLKKGLHWILNAAVAVGCAHALRVEFISNSNSPSISGHKEYLCPENWDLVTHCLQLFDRNKTSLIGRVTGIEEVLFSLLSNVAVHIAGRLWDVTDKVLAAAAKAISFTSNENKENCFCIKPALFVSRFHRLGDNGSNRSDLAEELQTPCDCYFFLGWLYCTYGKGNSMKRAMGVIRNGSALTSAKPSSSLYRRSINHHIGLTLTVADSLASANKNGEYLLCRTLTSKCVRLETIMDRYALHSREDALCWSTTVEAVAIRCRVLLAKGQSVHIYTNWLSQSVIGAIHSLRKSGDRRADTVQDREKMRVQESVFGNLVVLALNALKELTDLVYEKVLERKDGWRKILEEFVNNCESCMEELTKFGNDIVSMVRLNGSETVSIGKRDFLVAVLGVITNEIKLTVMVCRNGQEGRDSGVGEGLRDSKIRFALDKGLETFLVMMIESDVWKDDMVVGANVKKWASRALAQVLEITGVVQELRYGDEERRRIEQIVNRTFYGIMIDQMQTTSGLEIVQGSERERERMQNNLRIEFWSEYMCRNWAGKLFEMGSEMEKMAVKAIVLGMGYMIGDLENDGYKRILWNLIEDVRKVEHVYNSVDWKLDMEGGACGRAVVRWLDKTLRGLAMSWNMKEMMSLIEEVDKVMVDVIIRRNKLSEDVKYALMVHADLFLMSCCVALTMVGSLQRWLEPLSIGIMKLQGKKWHMGGDDIDKSLEGIQRRLMSGLGMVKLSGRDVESRVRVMRVVKAFGQAKGTFGGFWQGGLNDLNLNLIWMKEKQVGTYERQILEWQKLVFENGIEAGLCQVNEQTWDDAEVCHLLERFIEAVEMFKLCRESERGQVLVWQAMATYRKVSSVLDVIAKMHQGEIGYLWARIQHLLH